MAAPPPVRAPQALMDEIIEEIILRLPPAEPASLVRAALACHPWRRLIASPRFRRRFRAFHRTAPTLGLLCNIRDGDATCVVRSRFVPTSPVRPPRADQRDSFTCDSRHCRVLLCSMAGTPALLVWHPMTNNRWQLPSGPSLYYTWSATMLCAAMGACDHLDCPRGAFVVVVLTTFPQRMTLWVYTSEAGTWRKQPFIVPDVDLEFSFSLDLGPAALVGNTLYFSFNLLEMIVAYGLESWEASVIHVPPVSGHCDTLVMSSLMTLEDGALGVARRNEDARLSIWSMEANPNGEKRWTQIRVFELVKLLSVNAGSICSDFVGLSRGVGIFFKGPNDGLFTIDLNSGLIEKVCEEF